MTQKDFSNQRLCGRSFKGQNLTGANFSNSDIRGVNFANAILINANFQNARAGLTYPLIIVLSLVSLGLSGLSGFICGVSSAAFIYILQTILKNINSNIIFPIITILLITLAFLVRKAWVMGGSWGILFAGAGISAWAVTGVWAVNIGFIGIAAIIATIIGWKWVGIEAGVFGGSIMLMTIYLAWQAVHEKDKFAFLRRFAIAFASIRGTNFEGADLTEANFTGARLANTCFAKSNINWFTDVFPKLYTLNRAKIDRTCWYDTTGLEKAQVSGTVLSVPLVRELLVTGLGHKQSFARLNLQGVYLVHADLQGSDLFEVDLSGANLQGSSLVNANLTKVTAVGTNFRKANFTGACIEAWNIDNTTQLEETVCDYIYLRAEQKERRPSSGNFTENEFAKLFQEALNTVDFIFKNGIDWQAFLLAFDNLRAKVKVESNNAEISVQSIENKGDGVFVVKVSIPEYTEKEHIHKEFKEEYQRQIELVEAKYHAQLQGQEQQLAIYREWLADKQQENIRVDRIIDYLAERMKRSSDEQVHNVINIYESDINVGTIHKEVSNMSNISVQLGDGTTIHGDFVVANKIKESFNKAGSSNAPEQLKDLLKQLATAVGKMSEQLPKEQAEQVANDLQNLTNEATSKKPRKKWWELSVTGIKEAAESVGEIGKTALILLKDLIPILEGL